MGEGTLLSQEDIDQLLMGDEDADSSSGIDPISDTASLGFGEPDIPSLNGLDDLTSMPAEAPPKPAKKAKGKRTGRSSKPEYEDSTNMELLLDVKMNLSVELGRTKMKVDNVLNLGSGSVVELDKLNGELVDIMVNNRLVARGEVVAVDETFGVKVIEIIDPSERFKLDLL